MKKLIASVVGLAFLFSGTVFAQGLLQPDYSLMSAPALRIEVPEDCMQDFESTEPLPVVMPYSLFGRMNEDEMIFAYLDAALSPENIVNQKINYNAQKDLYYISVTVPINVEADTTVGEKNEYVNRIYNRFVVENPEYFYLVTESFSGGFGYTGDLWYCTLPAVICPDLTGFDGSREALLDLKNKYELLTEKTDEIAEALYFEGMTDLDKLLLAHDYLTDNCVYYSVVDENGDEYYGDGYSYNSYGAIMNEKAVCQGYTFAYTAILVKLGLPIENIRHVVSDSLDHIWNFVKLGDKWYHIDATWDDPTTPNYDMNNKSTQRTYHNYFLISDATNTAMRNKAGYVGFDMEIYGYEDLPGEFPTDTEYESGYIFSDFHVSIIEKIGNITYSDGFYKLDIGDCITGIKNGAKFYFENLNPTRYALSQPFQLENGSSTECGIKNLYNSQVLVFNCTETAETKNAQFFCCFYDANSRLVGVMRDNFTVRDLSILRVDKQTPENAEYFKLIMLADDGITPLANVPIVR